MYPGSWIVLVALIIHVIFFLVMSFVSPYFKKTYDKKWGGRILNIALMLVASIAFGVILFFNVHCTVAGQCDWMAMMVVAIVIVLVISNIVWGLYNHFKYKIDNDNGNDE